MFEARSLDPRAAWRRRARPTPSGPWISFPACVGAARWLRGAQVGSILFSGLSYSLASAVAEAPVVPVVAETVTAAEDRARRASEPNNALLVHSLLAELRFLATGHAFVGTARSFVGTGRDLRRA